MSRNPSLIMVKNLVTAAAQHPNGIAIAIVGAAHLNRMVEKLQGAGLRAAVIELESQPPTASVADPDPKSSTDGSFQRDKAWTDCSDLGQPGIPAIVNYLARPS